MGQVVLSTASLVAIALAMYMNVDKDKRTKYKSMFFSAALAVFLTGVTEPIEFMFMFAAPLLYVVYAITTGLAFAVADLIHVRVHAFGFIELLTRTPLLVKAGLTRDLINFAFTCIFFFGLNFSIFYVLIKKFNLPTPGRAGNYIETTEADSSAAPAQSEAAAGLDNSQASAIIGLLGGSANIEDVDACMTRLRVTVKDINNVATEKQWKENGALGLILKDKGVQAIYGPKADVLKSDIQDRLGM